MKELRSSVCNAGMPGVLQGDKLDSVALVESVDGPFLSVEWATSIVRLGLVSSIVAVLVVLVVEEEREKGGG